MASATSTASASATSLSGASSTSRTACASSAASAVVGSSASAGSAIDQRVRIGPGLERRGVGHRLDHRREARRVGLAVQPIEVLVHVGPEAVDLGLDLVDAVVDGRRMGPELVLELCLAGGDPVVGLLADASDLGLGPVADADHVVVGALAQGRGALGRTLADGLGDLARVGVELLERLVAGRRGRRTDRRRQVRHELGRLLRGRGRGGGGFHLDHALGLLGNLGLGRCGIGRSGIGRGFVGRALPGWRDAQPGMHVRVRPHDVVGGGLGGGLGRRLGAIGRRFVMRAIGAPREPETTFGVAGGHEQRLPLRDGHGTGALRRQ